MKYSNKYFPNLSFHKGIAHFEAFIGIFPNLLVVFIKEWYLKKILWFYVSYFTITKTFPIVVIWFWFKYFFFIVAQGIIGLKNYHIFALKFFFDWNINLFKNFININNNIFIKCFRWYVWIIWCPLCMILNLSATFRKEA